MWNTCFLKCFNSLQATVCNCLIKDRVPLQVLLTFDSLWTRQLQVDAVCQGAALQACNTNGWQHAIELFWHSRSRSTQASLISTNVAVKVAAKRQPWAGLMSLLTWMMASEFVPDGHTYSATLSNLPSWVLSLQTLQRETDRSPILVNNAFASISSESWPWSLQMLSELRHERLAVDTVLLNTLLKTLDRSYQWEFAIAALAICAKRPSAIAPPNGVSFNVCLSACETAEELSQALTLLQSMEEEHGVAPDVVSFSAVLSACAKSVQWETALEYLMVMKQRDILLDLVAYNSAITACAEAMQWGRTLQMLENVAKADTITFNAVLKGLEKSMQWENALAIFFDMRKRSVKPSLITYNTLMSACQKSSEWQWSLHFLREVDGQMVPDLVTYNSCLAACKKGSCWQGALQLWEKPAIRTERDFSQSLVFSHHCPPTVFVPEPSHDFLLSKNIQYQKKHILKWRSPNIPNSNPFF